MSIKIYVSNSGSRATASMALLSLAGMVPLVAVAILSASSMMRCTRSCSFKTTGYTGLKTPSSYMASISDILEWFRDEAECAGQGYQTAMNQALRNYIRQDKKAIKAIYEEGVFKPEKKT